MNSKVNTEERELFTPGEWVIQNGFDKDGKG